MLKAEVEQLQVQIQEPREVVFADVLLRRPKYVIFLQLLLKLAIFWAPRGALLLGKQPAVKGRMLYREGGFLGVALALPLTVGRCDLFQPGH